MASKIPLLGADPKGRKRLIAAGIAVILLAGGAAAWYLRPDRVEQVRALGEQLKSADLTPEQRREGWSKMREEMKKLTPQERQRFFAPMQQKMQEKYTRFFKLSRAEQIAELDRDIERVLKGGKSGKNGGQGRGGQGGFGGTGQNPGRGTGNGRGATDGATRNGSPAGSSAGTTSPAQVSGTGSGQAGDKAGAGPKSPNPEQREYRRQYALDFASPALQAQMADYRSMRDSRMKERGITPPTGGPRGFGGFAGFGPR